MEKVKNNIIIEGCRKGSRNAQIELYKSLAPRLYRSCLRIIGNPQEAEEAMQDSILKILKFLSTGSNEELEYFDSWSNKIAIRTAIDYVRKQSVQTEDLNEYTLTDEETDDSDSDFPFSVEAIKNACNELAPGYRVVLSLYLFEGYDMEEIGEILNLKPSSVRSQYMRGKRKLLEVLSKTSTK